MQREEWLQASRRARQEGRLREAARSLEQALAKYPSDRDLLLELTPLLEQLESHDNLLERLGQALDSAPGDAELRMVRARIQASLGCFEESARDYRKVLSTQPGHVGAFCSLVHAGHGESVGGLEAAEGLLNGKPGHRERFRLLYARAYLLEQAEQYDAAFADYAEANRLQAQTGGMDIRAKQRGAAAVMKDLSKHVLDQVEGVGDTSGRPVFIVGMPRSGTSLTEQILSRHPQVHALGEQTFMGEALRDLIAGAPRKKGPLPLVLDAVATDVWSKAGGNYLSRIREINPHSPRVTDKLPANFALLPWIRLLLPGARIIHVRRHPLATLSSCIRTPFADDLLSFSIENWGRFYGLYEALMNAWRPQLTGVMHEIHYEDLVTDLPGQARRLVQFLGLDWDDACLQPERGRRAVRTASVAQVRREVSASSMHTWRRYREQLQVLPPLAEESRRQIERAAGQ
jgi:tetratricopeptide (TPR) repeat protein